MLNMFGSLRLTKFTIFPVSASSRFLVPDSREREASITLQFDDARIVKTLCMMAILLVLSSICTQLLDQATGQESIIVHKLVKLMNVDLEMNIPTFFSTLILLFSSLLLAVIGIFTFKSNQKYTFHWMALSAGFMYLAFDEAFSIHERLIEPMRAVLGEDNLGIFYFAWVVPAIMAVFAISLVFIRFGFSLPKTTRNWFILAAALYLGAALGFELIEGKHVEIFGKENFTYIALATAEEGLEIAGIIVFIRTLLRHIASLSNSVQVIFFPD